MQPTIEDNFCEVHKESIVRSLGGAVCEMGSDLCPTRKKRLGGPGPAPHFNTLVPRFSGLAEWFAIVAPRWTPGAGGSRPAECFDLQDW